MICSTRKYANSEPLFSQLNVFTIFELYILRVQMFMYKYHNRILPNIFSDFYAYNHDIHGYFTRQSRSLHVPLYQLTSLSKFIRTVGVRTSNFFIQYLDYNCTISMYKNQLKKFIKASDTSFLMQGTYSRKT